MTRKLILLDIDGTLVGRSHRIPGDAVLAVKAAQANGHLVMICTGRARPEIEEHILAPGFDGLIAVSGAYIEVEGELRSESFIKPEAITRASRALEQLGVDYLWQSSKGMWATAGYLDKLLVKSRFAADDARREMWYDIADARREAESRGVGLGDVVPGSKGTFLVPDDSPVTVADVHEALKNDLVVINGSMGIFAKVNGEIMIPGVTKGGALQQVAAMMGVDMKDTIAVGDSDNDLAMLEVAGTAVAMGNGNDNVKHIADLVTGDVDEGGLLNAFTALDLI